VLVFVGVRAWRARHRLVVPACRALETNGWRFRADSVLDEHVGLRAVEYSRREGEYTLAAVIFLWTDQTEFDSAQFWVASPAGQPAGSSPTAAVEALGATVERLVPGAGAATLQAYAALPVGRNMPGRREGIESTAHTPSGWRVTASRETDDEGNPERVVLVFWVGPP
jgi:hypothetical protein